MKIINKSYVVFILVLFLFIGVACSQSKFSKDLGDSFLFEDGFGTYSGVKFFNLLDGFPVMKKGIASLKPYEFNLKLNASMQAIHPTDVNGSLRALQHMLLDVRPTIQSSLRTVASILERLRTGDPASYETINGYLERLRWYPVAILRGVIPISATFILEEYNNKGTDTLKNQVLSFTSELKSTNSYNMITKVEDMAFKALFLNANVRSASEQLVNGFVSSSIVGDPVLRNAIVNLAYSLGDMMYEKAGFVDYKPADTVVKELMVNLEKYYTVGGAGYTGIYVNTDYPSDLTTVVYELYKQVRYLIRTNTASGIAPPWDATKTSGITKSTSSPSNSSIPMSIVNELMVNIALFDFSATVTDVDSSLKKLVKQDFQGNARESGGISVSAIESLFFVLSIVDSFGFDWVTTDSNDITGATGGKMNVGDTLWAMQSVISGGNGTNFRKILQDNADSRGVFKDNIELSTNASAGGDPVYLNTAVLRLLEKESIGATSPVTVRNTKDTIYVKTIPWVMNWIKKVLYQGYGPYYNKNKRDTSGNYLTPDGSIYITDSTSPSAKYKSSWTTYDYKICIKSRNAANTADKFNWVGLGGRETTTTSCTGPLTPPTTKTYTYTISEIAKTDAERAVSSDEEAFYKNFQWLLYEKRFVVIIPAKSNLQSIEEALFIIAIGNGLKGMMGLKPNCGTSGNVADCLTYNGYWNKNSTLRIKDYNSKNTDLVNFSDSPGDSTLLIEGWDYGSTQVQTTLQPTFIYSITYNLLIPNPSTVKGMIPPVISQNFDVLERLGFLNTAVVKPSDVPTYWEDRNKVTPLVAALAKTIDDQVFIDSTSSANNKDPYPILTKLAKLLARPAIFKETDITTGGVTYESVRIASTNNGVFGLRSASLSSSNYYPNTNQRSTLSFLVENTRRYQDGVLNLLSKTKILTGLVNLMGTLGRSDKATGRGQILSGLIQIMAEVKLTSENPSATQFNIQTYIDENITKLAAYPDTRSSDLSSNDWYGVSDAVFFIRDYLGRNSGFSLVTSLSFLLQLLADVPPTPKEVTAFIELFGQILKNSDGTQAYRIRSILQTDVPILLEAMAPYARNMYAMAGGLGQPGNFLSYMENNMGIVPYSIRDLLWDFEKFCTSELIQRKDNDENSLLFSSGILIRAFADIHQFGKKLDPYGFPFADNMNIDDNGTEANVWNRLNMILSSKK
ncbi:MAG: hypothetical protein EBS19_00285 [Spirochaetia bacterium]|nr:hypothetical protein [Spirochaetia bacterium]